MNPLQLKLMTDIVNELISVTPEWWKSAVLRLEFKYNGDESSCSHEIHCREHVQDIVVATDELMSATRQLGLAMQDKGRLKSATITVCEDASGQWSYITDFAYVS